MPNLKYVFIHTDKYNKTKTNNRLLWFIAIVILFLSLTIRMCEARHPLPAYVIEHARVFRIPVWYSSNFMMAESSGIEDSVSISNAYGYYQIRKPVLNHYLRLAGFNTNAIKDVKKFLINGKNNSYIFHYMTRIWLNCGYKLDDIPQIWLFGETGFLNGRYSISFRDKIIQKRKNNEEDNIINRYVALLVAIFRNFNT